MSTSASPGSNEEWGITIEDLPKELGLEAIYVRKAYTEILSIIREDIAEFRRYKAFKKSAIRITGTPGIGKSYFLGYVYHQLIKDNTVIARAGNHTILSRPGDKYVKISGEAVEDYLKDDVVFLVDPDTSYSPGPSDAVTILFVSPSKKRVGNFPRVTLRDCYMPPWHEDELKDCIEKLYPFALDRFDERFKKWGGSIRSMCFSHTERAEEALQRSLESLLSNETLIHIINEVTDSCYTKQEYDSWQWIVHRNPIENEECIDYTKCTCSFPSQHITSLVTDRIRNLEVDWKTMGDPILLGRAYETHVSEVLFKVSANTHLPIRAKKIEGGKLSESDQEVPAVKERIFFTSMQTFETPKEHTLYVPFEGNKAGMDLAMPPWIFQITIAKTHSAKRLEKLLEQFPKTTSWKLVFVIPSARMKNFTSPNLSMYSLIEEKYLLPFDFYDDGTPNEATGE